MSGLVHARYGRQSASLNGGLSGRRNIREGAEMEPSKVEEAGWVSGKCKG